MTDYGFQPGDQVRALLYPELGTGKILSVSGPTVNPHAARVARVTWETGQTSTHSYAALAHLDPPSDEGGKQEETVPA